jgi:hypothetical protein
MRLFIRDCINTPTVQWKERDEYYPSEEVTLKGKLPAGEVDPTDSHRNGKC